VDVALIIRRRLNELGLEQKDLADAAQVTESYISQLLARKKVRPRPTERISTTRWGSFWNFRAASFRSWRLFNAGELKKKIADPRARCSRISGS